VFRIVLVINAVMFLVEGGAGLARKESPVAVRVVYVLLEESRE
jgi:hypothetical protein